MNWKVTIWTIVIILLIGTTIYLVTDGFDITGVPDCEFTAENNYTCELDYNLQEKRGASIWQYYMQFDTVASGEVMGRQVVTPFVSGGPWVDEGDEQYDEICKEDRETTWLYLYRIPSTFPEYYELYVDTITDAVAEVSSPIPDVDLDIRVKYISYPYTYSNIQICTEEDRDDCSNGEYAIVHLYNKEYTSVNYGNWNEDKVRIRNDPLLDDNLYEDITTGGSSDVGIEFADPIWANGTISPEILDLVPEDLVFMVEITKDITNRCDWSATIDKPPITYISYRAANWPTDISYSIVDRYGEEYLIESLTGVQKDDVDTLDVGNIINNACDRDVASYSCDFHLRVKSNTPGIMSVTEEHVLHISDKPITDPDPDPDKVIWYTQIWEWILNIPNIIMGLFN